MRAGVKRSVDEDVTYPWSKLEDAAVTEDEADTEDERFTLHRHEDLVVERIPWQVVASFLSGFGSGGNSDLWALYSLDSTAGKPKD